MREGGHEGSHGGEGGHGRGEGHVYAQGGPIAERGARVGLIRQSGVRTSASASAGCDSMASLRSSSSTSSASIAVWRSKATRREAAMDPIALPHFPPHILCR